MELSSDQSLHILGRGGRYIGKTIDHSVNRTGIGLLYWVRATDRYRRLSDNKCEVKGEFIVVSKFQ